MAGQICDELLDMVALAERIITGEELEVSESFDHNGVDILVIFSNLKEFLLTVEGEGNDMNVVLRSVNIPELTLGLPKPVYVNMGSPLVVEDFC
tara:strand:+ start:542 stop:823 length:282 start_codon:yes stop_codon:yes gene_type:complete